MSGLAAVADDNFRDWLLSQGKTHWTIKHDVNYAKRFEHILDTGDASELMKLSPRNKHHAMNALANMAKFTGCYDVWLAIRQKYSLKWTSRKESLQSFERFFNDELNYDTMLQRVREMIQALPASYGNIIKFDCLTGLRPAEAVESVHLINDKEKLRTYYNLARQGLEHFRFPEVFFRQTKKAYISFVDPETLDIVKSCRHNSISYNAIRLAARSKDINMDMRFCRKIFASHLRQSGIESEIVDLLQGRVPRTVFARHYFTPKLEYRTKGFYAL
jgi:intergrase/recombinase